MENLSALLARGERLCPAVAAVNGVVVVTRPGASTEMLSVAAAMSVASQLIEAAAEATGQALYDRDAKERGLR